MTDGDRRGDAERSDAVGGNDPEDGDDPAGDTIGDIDHEGPGTSANAVWARGDDVDRDAGDESR